MIKINMNKKIFILLLLCGYTNAFLPLMIEKTPLSVQHPKPEQYNKLNYYFAITKPKYIPCSFGLPLLGSYITSSNIGTIINPQVLLTALLSVLIGSGFLIINNYFNHKNKIKKNQDDIILNKKHLTPEEALKVYIVINILCFSLIIYFIKSYFIKIVLVNNIILSYIYTPYISRIPLLKNSIKAGIISQPLVLGGIASNIHSYSILPATLYLFSMIMWKELNTDILCVYKDKKYKIKTLPTLIGVFNTHLLSFFFLSLGILIPYGTKSHLFILLHSPLILNSIRLIYTRKIIDKKYLTLSNTIMTLSGIYMCLI